MRDIDTEMVLRLVAENAKQRFELAWGYDPSPVKVKAKKGQGKGKGKEKAKPVPTVQAVQADGAAGGSGQDVKDQRDEGVQRVEKEVERHEAHTGAVDTAKVDDLAVSLEKASIHTELPLVILPRPDADNDTNESKSPEAPEPTLTSTSTVTRPGEWFIRATQGHSIKLDSVSHLTLVTDDEDGRARAGVCVHGTRWELWDVLSESSSSSLVPQLLRSRLKSIPSSQPKPMPNQFSFCRLHLLPHVPNQVVQEQQCSIVTALAAR
jgi:2'-phosphotransferase